MGSAAKYFVDLKLVTKKIVLFSKSANYHDCGMAQNILSQYDLPHKYYEVVNIEKRQDCTQIENYLQILCLNDSRTMPILFVNGEYIGGTVELSRLHERRQLWDILTKHRGKESGSGESGMRFVPPEFATRAGGYCILSVHSATQYSQ